MAEDPYIKLMVRIAHVLWLVMIPVTLILLIAGEWQQAWMAWATWALCGLKIELYHATKREDKP